MADPWFNESSNMACGPWRFGSGSVQHSLNKSQIEAVAAYVSTLK
jgi:hypothetical protein